MLPMSTNYTCIFYLVSCFFVIEIREFEFAAKSDVTS